MFSPDQYELIDFGKDENGVGRKLESFAGVVVSRVSPPANSAVRTAKDAWSDCDGRFAKSLRKGQAAGQDTGQWTFRSPPETWQVKHREIVLQLKPTPVGHLGLFAEQQSNWDWIEQQIRKSKTQLNVLNLFAYTGGSTLTAAAAGAKVTHIDSARNIVNWARGNAEVSGLADAPIRWIAEDCQRFVEREVKRGHRYDAIILDPPSFGHGPKGEVWKIERDLIGLLRNCKKLFSDQPAFALLTCHSEGYGPAELQATFCDAIFGTCSTQVFSGPLSIKSRDGRRLNAGNFVRWAS